MGQKIESFCTQACGIFTWTHFIEHQADEEESWSEPVKHRKKFGWVNKKEVMKPEKF